MNFRPSTGKPRNRQPRLLGRKQEIDLSFAAPDEWPQIDRPNRLSIILAWRVDRRLPGFL